MFLAILWMCLLQPVVLVTVTSSRKEHRGTPNGAESLETDLWNQDKSQTMFAKRGEGQYQKFSAMKPHMAPRCSRVTESCLPHSRCCDPCSFCRCRIFHTICYCWRLGRCQHRT